MLYRSPLSVVNVYLAPFSVSAISVVLVCVLTVSNLYNLAVWLWLVCGGKVLG